MSNPISQKTAVVNEVMSVLGSSFDETLPAKDQLTPEQFSTIKANIVSSIVDGSISFNKDVTDEKEVARYVSGMISNHFRKAKELNGGASYAPQSTGRGSRDSQLSELSKLLGTYDEGSEEFNQIVSAIDSRKSELSAEKTAFSAERKRQKELASINTDALPDSVKSLAENLVSGFNLSNLVPRGGKSPGAESKRKCMIKLIVVFTILLGMTIFTQANAYEKNHDCVKNPIYCQIVSNRPTIKRAYAFKLSNVIAKRTRAHKLDPVIFTAILAQESMYDVKAKNCTTGLVEVMVKDHLGIVDLDKSPAFIKKRVCTDFGIGQIWYKTADSYDFDLVKLTSDMEYSVEASLIVLKYFKSRYSKKEVNWWTRYNASNPTARSKYKVLVERFTNAD